MKLKTHRRKGFTLVEIMIVVAIIGLLCAMAIPSFVRARENSRQKVCVNNLRQLDGAKDQAAIENNIGTGDDVSVYVELYLKAGVPVCPVNKTDYILNLTGEPPECDSPAAQNHNDAYLNQN
jgi:prepilin-type N-terminal cleavage/methylation domain-containing protein